MHSYNEAEIRNIRKLAWLKVHTRHHPEASCGTHLSFLLLPEKVAKSADTIIG